MTADIIPFPKPRPWSKYTHDAASRAGAERLYETCKGIPLMEAKAEFHTVELLSRCAEIAARKRGDLPPAS